MFNVLSERPFIFIKNNNNCKTSLLTFSIAQTANNSPFDIVSLEREVPFFKCSKIKGIKLFFLLSFTLFLNAQSNYCNSITRNVFENNSSALSNCAQIRSCANPSKGSFGILDFFTNVFLFFKL